MVDLIDILAQWLQTILPGFVRLPNLTFALPHAAYWGGLILFPLIAMYLVRREVKHSSDGDIAVLPLAYLMWLVGGLVGLHRFYLRAPRLAFAYIVAFIGILYGNQRRDAVLEELSSARYSLREIEFSIERLQDAVNKGAEGAAEKLAEAEQVLGPAQSAMAEATLHLDQWMTFGGGMGLIILILLLIDAVLMPRLYRRCLELEAKEPVRQFIPTELPARADPRSHIHNPLVDSVERINGWVGEFIAYWSVIGVFVYFYEVMARYVFNSPTNWAHEAMFLMFGMQYMLAGGYAARVGAHVRVDVLYEHLSDRAKAIVDLVTSVFFFIFTVTLLVTGGIFMLDSIEVWEVSFTEWAIQYWPVKSTLVIGALLITAQGIVKLIRDITYLRQLEA